MPEIKTHDSMYLPSNIAELTAPLNAHKNNPDSQLKRKIRSITFVIQYPYVYNVYKSEH